MLVDILYTSVTLYWMTLLKILASFRDTQYFLMDAVMFTSKKLYPNEIYLKLLFQFSSASCNNKSWIQANQTGRQKLQWQAGAELKTSGRQPGKDHTRCQYTLALGQAGGSCWRWNPSGGQAGDQEQRQDPFGGPAGGWRQQWIPWQLGWRSGPDQQQEMEASKRAEGLEASERPTGCKSTQTQEQERPQAETKEHTRHQQTQKQTWCWSTQETDRLRSDD